MILKKLIIENMFAYSGKIEIDLEPKGEKNIILIGARNGRGKTSFLRIIRILLHGLKENSEFTQHDVKLSPKEYALGKKHKWEGIFNTKSQSQFAKVSGYFEFNNKRLEISRQFHKRSNNFDEELHLFYDLQEESTPQEFIESFLPKNFAQFFFFDGEKLEGLIDTESNNIKESLEVLLNIKTYEKLIENIKSVRNDLRKKTKDSPTVIQLNSLEHQKDGFKLKTKENKAQIQLLQKDIKSADIEIIELTEKLTDLLVDTKVDIKSIQAEKKKLEIELSNLKSYLAKKIRGIDILVLITENISRDYLAQLEDDKIDYKLDEQIKKFRRVLNSLIPEIQNNVFLGDIPAKHRVDSDTEEFYQDKIRDETNKAWKSFKDKIDKNKPIINFQEDDKKKLSTIFEQKISIYEKLTRFKRIENRLKVISEEFEFATEDAGKNDDEIKRLKSNKDVYEDLKSRNILEIGKLEKEIETYSSQTFTLKNKIVELSKKIVLTKPILNSLDLSEELMHFFQTFKANLLKSKIANLENALNLYLGELAFDKSWIKQVTISQKFELRIFGFDNQDIALNSLSAGQRQILATALIQALGLVSNSNSFLAIDTPLARIDLENRKQITENFYPKASEQVILLSTNVEIDPSKSDYRNLQKYIAKEYTITSENYSSSFENGYFTEIKRLEND